MSYCLLFLITWSSFYQQLCWLINIETLQSYLCVVGVRCPLPQLTGVGRLRKATPFLLFPVLPVLGKGSAAHHHWPQGCYTESQFWDKPCLRNLLFHPRNLCTHCLLGFPPGDPILLTFPSRCHQAPAWRASCIVILSGSVTRHQRAVLGWCISEPTCGPWCHRGTVVSCGALSTIYAELVNSSVFSSFPPYTITQSVRLDHWILSIVNCSKTMQINKVWRV